MSYTMWMCVIVLAAVTTSLIINWCVYHLCRSAMLAALTGALLPGLSIIGYSLYVESQTPHGPAVVVVGLIVGVPALLLGSMTVVLAVLTASTRSST